MNTPGFNAEASLYRSSHEYRSAAGPGWSGRAVQPAQQIHIPVSPVPFPVHFGPIGDPFNCLWQCGGDPGCIACCMCVRAGGHPRLCCY